MWMLLPVNTQMVKGLWEKKLSIDYEAWRKISTYATKARQVKIIHRIHTVSPNCRHSFNPDFGPSK